MHIARNATTTHGLIIVEGYADWVTLQEQGIRNCAAIGGTALTEDHIFLISELGIKKISLCLDGDASGRAATTKILDEVISKAPRLAVDIIMLPEGLDPDDYIKQNKATTASPWDTVPIVSCFSWRLKELTKDAPPEEVATRMIPLIMTESSMVKREQLAKELAGQTAIRFETIISELDRLGNIEKLKNSERWNSIAKDIASDLMRKPTNAKIILEQGLEHLSGLESGDSIENLGVDEMLNGFEAVTQNWLSRSTEILGLRTGFKEFDNAFSGLQKAKLYLFGGKPNHGKTALMHSIALGVCRNSDDNTTVIVHSTDDDRPTVMARIVSGITGIPINDVTNPKIAFKLPAPLDGKIHDQYLVQKWKDGVAELKEYLASGKLVIKDINNGNTLGFTESLIKYYKEKNPERNYVVIFDNFHKAQDFPELGEQEVTRTKKMSEQCKTICQRYNVPFLATVEYRKIREGYRPTSSDVASSGQLHYDSDVLAHVYNDFHDKGNEIGASKFVTIIEGNTIPIIDVTVSKNKLSSFKGRLHFYLHGDKGSVRECPASHIANIISAQQNPEALRGLNGQ
jgi:replicative DNA helicase